MATTPIVTVGPARAEVLVNELVMINEFLIDCCLSDNHNYESEVTDFPVESGSTISDNIRNKPLVVTMECIVSNTPIGKIVKYRNNTSDPASSAYEVLIKIREDKQPVPIRTSLRTFENMALQNLTIPRSSGRGDELRFTATFKQIEIVINKRGTRVAIPGAIAKTSSNKTTAQLKAELEPLIAQELAFFGTHPGTPAGDVNLSIARVQEARIAASAENDRVIASQQNLGQRVTFGKATGSR